MRIQRTCLNHLCGKSFTTFPSEIKKGGGKYCSFACRTRALPFVCAHPPCHNFVLLTPSALAEGRKYCSRACSEMLVPLDERFWSYVARCGHIDCVYCCWEWTGHRKKSKWNYGMFHMETNGRSKQHRAHRIAWELHHRQAIPEPLWACHYCSNPPCCNPAHLYPGTPQQNSHDAVVRGSFIGVYRGPVLYGEALGHGKLTVSKVLLIRERAAHGERQSVIAADLGVCRATISMVVHRKIWAHVP